MKQVVAVGMCLGLAALMGCHTSRPGGVQAGQDETFRITTPVMATHVKQGEMETANVCIRRGRTFKQDVTVRTDAPANITVEPKEFTIHAADKPEMQVRIMADKRAPLGEYTVNVTGTPQNGAQTTVPLLVRVMAP